MVKQPHAGSVVEINERTIELAKQPYLRMGSVDIDLAYLLAVWDAQGRIDIGTLAELHPGKPVSIGWMGWVPEGWVRK